ncbi:MAG TPA: DEAD/DEAH box helicase family protein [Chitinophagales bacterium]|nr:DEAD/DEAH box helicase family protein [Chitinophagales bacterium]
MELKPYQQQVLNDLARFLEHIQETKDAARAFHKFWLHHPQTPLHPYPGKAVEPYKNNVPRVPHICLKVPTAGGKTFIACNALKTIFDAFDYNRPQAVVWLVPSITILEQTLKNLKDPAHPYRQKINTYFANRVAVFDKETLLQGSGFNATSVKEQLSIMVFSFDSLRAKNKEDRKVFQENGNLQSFENLLGKDADITLGAVIKHLNPLVVVDESHNAESNLSIEMLKEVNPCFILDLTATPRKNSNILSFIDALELKRENMVKLPVIVYNHQDKTEVINTALQLQKSLELQALQEEKNGGKYIRPIVLFQAQPKNGKDFLTAEEEKSNVQKLKDKLIELKIPDEQIKIKTANINEIKGIDLLSRQCPIRYIITINALKEGWDCPFAYILASLADKNSAVDVEQILGRILRQPYVLKHNFELLNVSYVLTASSKFRDTLQNIVKGLNKAGFSDKDFKLADPNAVMDSKPPTIQPNLFGETDNNETTEDITKDIDATRITLPADNPVPNNTIQHITQSAIAETRLFDEKIAQTENTHQQLVPNELHQLMKTYPIKAIFKTLAANIKLPQFFIKVPANSLFEWGETDNLLEKEYLFKAFELSKADTHINFDSVTTEIYKVDLDETRKEHTPTFVKLDNRVKDNIITYMLAPERKGSRVKNITQTIMQLIGNMPPIPDKEIEKYIRRILENFTDEQFADFEKHKYSYVSKIKQKIDSLTETYAEQQFKDWLDTDKLFIRPAYTLPQSIAPAETAKDIAKSLYEKEGKINSFEEKVINEVANLTNIAFWTRNTERKGFRINGFINHYPDFIIYTKSGKTILLETKGDHLDAEQKIKLGNLWANKAGNAQYKYFMVYQNREVDDAYTLDKFLRLLKEI